MSKIIKFEGEFTVTVKPRGYKETGDSGTNLYLLIDSDDIDIKFEISKNIKLSGHHPLIVFKSTPSTSMVHIAANKLKNGLPVSIVFDIDTFERTKECVGNRSALYYCTLSNNQFKVVSEFVETEPLHEIDTSFSKLDDEPDMSIVPNQWKDDECEIG